MRKPRASLLAPPISVWTSVQMLAARRFVSAGATSTSSSTPAPPVSLSRSRPIVTVAQQHTNSAPAVGAFAQPRSSRRSGLPASTASFLEKQRQLADAQRWKSQRMDAEELTARASAEERRRSLQHLTDEEFEAEEKLRAEVMSLLSPSSSFSSSGPAPSNNCKDSRPHQYSESELLEWLRVADDLLARVASLTLNDAIITLRCFYVCEVDDANLVHALVGRIVSLLSSSTSCGSSGWSSPTSGADESCMLHLRSFEVGPRGSSGGGGRGSSSERARIDQLVELHADLEAILGFCRECGCPVVVAEREDEADETENEEEVDASLGARPRRYTALLTPALQRSLRAAILGGFAGWWRECQLILETGRESASANHEGRRKIVDCLVTLISPVPTSSQHQDHDVDEAVLGKISSSQLAHLVAGIDRQAADARDSTSSAAVAHIHPHPSSDHFPQQHQESNPTTTLRSSIAKTLARCVSTKAFSFAALRKFRKALSAISCSSMAEASYYGDWIRVCEAREAAVLAAMPLDELAGELQKEMQAAKSRTKSSWDERPSSATVAYLKAMLVNRLEVKNENGQQAVRGHAGVCTLTEEELDRFRKRFEVLRLLTSAVPHSFLERLAWWVRQKQVVIHANPDSRTFLPSAAQMCDLVDAFGAKRDNKDLTRALRQQVLAACI